MGLESQDRTGFLKRRSGAREHKEFTHAMKQRPKPSRREAGTPPIRMEDNQSCAVAKNNGRGGEATHNAAVKHTKPTGYGRTARE